MSRASLPETPQTLELQQLNELNTRLKQSDLSITAGELGLAGATLLSGSAEGGLPGSAVLVQLSWSGPPEYPYVHGHFRAGSTQGAAPAAELHTAALRALGHLLGVHQHWGT
jgi:hypothetical protein